MNRREFLGRTVSGAGVLALTGAGLSAEGRSIKRIGLQLYTVRTEMQKDFEGTLARVAEVGYQEVEFAGYFGRAPEDVKRIVDKYGLSSPSSHIALDLFTNDFQKTIETAKILKQTYLVCPWLGPESRKTLDDYKKLAETFDRIGGDCKKAGFDFVYHNHDFEFAPLDGQIPFDVLMNETDPKLVGFELDLYWVARANHDPVKYLEANTGRVPLVHVKDMAKGPGRGFADVGSGVMDFKTIFEACEKAGVKHYIVEHDQPADPFQSIKNSYDYLRAFRF
jgi:sugar phosphate isomerase/epimerase